MKTLNRCPKCERVFGTQGALNGHQRKHSFFNYLGTLRSPEEREKERKDAHDNIIGAVIKHFSRNYNLTGEKPHCDVCAVVKDKVDGPLMRDLLAWLDSDKKPNEPERDATVSKSYRRQIEDLTTYFAERLPECEPITLTAQERARGVDSLQGKAAEIVAGAISKWRDERNYELSYNQVCMAFFYALDRYQNIPEDPNSQLSYYRRQSEQPSS